KYASERYLTLSTLPGLSATSVSVQLEFFQMYVRPPAVRTGSPPLGDFSISFMSLVARETSIAVWPSALPIRSSALALAIGASRGGAVVLGAAPKVPLLTPPLPEPWPPPKRRMNPPPDSDWASGA